MVYPFQEKTGDFEDFGNDLNTIFSKCPVIKCRHLLDCLYRTVVYTECADTFVHGSRSKIPTATELDKAGIKFSSYYGNVGSYKLGFKNHVVCLPRVKIYNTTESIFRNLMVYEICSNELMEVCSYALIMDHLIDTHEDVKLLIDSGIIENHIGDNKEVAKIWNKINHNVVITLPNRWLDICNSINLYYNNSYNTLYTEFMNRYFSRPWVTVSVIAAFVIIVATILQTIYTLLGYYK